MVIALGFCTFFLAVLCLFFALRARILRLSVREIREQAREKSATDSGTPVCPQSGDKDIRALAEYLTDELDRLIAARRTYAAGNSELKEAVTGVSHDLRTPLTSVSGYLDLLAKSGLSERQAEYVRIIGGRVEAMKKLTEELLAYSVVATDEGSLQSEEVCINSLLEDCLMQFYVAFSERGICPEVRLPEGRVVRRTGKDALSRVFGNILANAARYSDGDLSVTMDEDCNILFENSASKLDEVSVCKLFDRFFTVENARGSTGLGLSVAKILVEKMGGKIEASWKEGRLRISLSL